MYNDKTGSAEKIIGPVYYIRAMFSRDKSVKFISHLDIIRMFSRTFRRAAIPMSWSHGFNPHPEMVFALPLGVGVTSESEYMDIGLEEEIDPNDFINKANEYLPKGFRFIKAAKSSGKGLMASVDSALYEIEFQDNACNELHQKIEKAINEINKQEMIIVKKFIEKNNKKSFSEINIRPMIRSVEFATNIRALVDAGSKSNLRVDLLYGAIKAVLENDQVTHITDVNFHRKGLFTLKEGQLSELWQ